jgi:hypothetical protein
MAGLAKSLFDEYSQFIKDVHYAFLIPAQIPVVQKIALL